MGNLLFHLQFVTCVLLFIHRFMEILCTDACLRRDLTPQDLQDFNRCITQPGFLVLNAVEELKRPIIRRFRKKRQDF